MDGDSSGTNQPHRQSRKALREARKKQLDEIIEWVGRTGYRLEMETAFALRKAGYRSVAMTQYFPGDSPGELREVDVIGSFPCQVDGGIYVDVSLAIECKYSSGTPWVNLVSPANVGLVNWILNGYSTPSLQRWIAKIPELAGPGSDLTLGKAGVNLGHRLIPYFPDKDSLSDPTKIGTAARRKQVSPQQRKEEEPFWAVDNSLRAAAAKVNLPPPGVAAGISTSKFELVRPVVVVDADLIECSLTAGGRLKGERVESTRLVREAWNPHNPQVIVEIVSFRSFGKWARTSAAIYGPIIKALNATVPLSSVD
jgi:hypothetical protein